MNTKANVKRRAVRMTCLAALLAVGPILSSASEVTITITGTVWEGTDYTGVFGFAANTDLTGKPYTLVFTFDDTKGMQGSSSADSYIENTATSNPGTGALTIGMGTFTFASTQYSPQPVSEAYMGIGGSNPAYGTSYGLAVGNGTYGSEWNDIQGTIDPANGTVLNNNTSWESPFTNSNLAVYASDNYSLSFGIIEEAEGLHAGGYLTTDTITISGPQSISAPEPVTWALIGAGLIVFVGVSNRCKLVGMQQKKAA
jgi:hypothetical protein